MTSSSLFASDGKKEFTVQGTFKPVGVGEVFGGNIAVMDVYSAQVVFHRGRKFDRIDLMNAPTVPVEVVQQRLRAQLPPGVEVDRPEVRGEALENAVTAMRVGILITSFVALLVGVYIIFNSFTIAVNQRWKEIGILRAVGVEQGNVSRMFLCEALLMGVIGSLVGIAGGFLLASAANRVMRGMVAAVYGVVSTAAPAKLHLDQCAIAFVLGVAASMIGAWFPARGAACLDPALALHNIEARHRETVLGWKRMGGGVLMIVAGSALVYLDSVAPGLADSICFRHDRSAGPDDCAAEAGALVGARVAADHELGWRIGRRPGRRRHDSDAAPKRGDGWRADGRADVRFFHHVLHSELPPDD